MSNYDDAIDVDASSSEERKSFSSEDYEDDADGQNEDDAAAVFEEEEDENIDDEEFGHDEQDFCDTNAVKCGNRESKRVLFRNINSVLALSKSQTSELLSAELNTLQTSVDAALAACEKLSAQQKSSLIPPLAAAAEAKPPPPSLVSFSAATAAENKSSSSSKSTIRSVIDRLEKIKSQQFVANLKDQQRLEDLLSTWSSRHKIVSDRIQQVVSNSMTHSMIEQLLAQNQQQTSNSKSNLTSASNFISKYEPKSASQFELDALKSQLAASSNEVEMLRARLAAAEKNQQNKSPHVSAHHHSAAAASIPKQFSDAKLTLEFLPAVVTDGWCFSCNNNSKSLKMVRAAHKQELVIEILALDFAAILESSTSFDQFLTNKNAAGSPNTLVSTSTMHFPSATAVSKYTVLSVNRISNLKVGDQITASDLRNFLFHQAPPPLAAAVVSTTTVAAITAPSQTAHELPSEEDLPLLNEQRQNDQVFHHHEPERRERERDEFQKVEDVQQISEDEDVAHDQPSSSKQNSSSSKDSTLKEVDENEKEEGMEDEEDEVQSQENLFGSSLF
jgi:hypothetical protein